LPAIAARRAADATILVDALSRLRDVVEALPADVTDPLERAAMARIGTRDPRDWPVVAAALALGCPICTEDQDFFGTGVPTWTTATVDVYLRGD